MLIFAILIVSGSASAQEHNWNSHADVAKKVQETFEAMKSYQANFQITTVDQGKSKSMSGTCYFQKPGKVRFAFTQPAGDLMVSDGKLLWIYINKLKAAGKQDLSLQTKDESGKRVFLETAGPGIARLFRKYHYRFDTVKQPRDEDGHKYFVLDMEQREKIGGFETIKLYIDASSYIIKKAVGTDGFGRITTIVFSNQQVNPSLEGKLFQYQPDDSVRVVSNPLVND